VNLPPPDPNEGGSSEAGLELPAPTVVYLSGSPSPRDEAFADALLAARPGALFVAA
jgi:hypothetical protein